MRRVALTVALAFAAAVPAAGLSSAAIRSPLAACTFGTDVPGLRGYLAGAVGSAADVYARGLAADSDRQRAQARQAFGAAAAAYVYGLPQVSVRGTVRHFPRNEVLSINALADPSVRTVVSPNVDTAYTVSWLDLVNGPLVVNVPDTGGRYYTFQFLDAFSNAFAYVGSGSTGTAAGAYAIVPPGFTGPLPLGLTRIDAPSTTVWLLGRTLVGAAADLPAVRRLQSQYEVTPLTAWTLGARQPSVVLDRYPPTIPRSVPTGAQFIATLNQEMTIDPPPATDDCALSAMSPAGVAVPHPTPADTLAADLTDQAWRATPCRVRRSTPAWPPACGSSRPPRPGWWPAAPTPTTAGRCSAPGSGATARATWPERSSRATCWRPTRRSSRSTRSPPPTAPAAV